jgi:hypothetical protein
MFGPWAAELHPQLKRSTEVYCEGRLKLEGHGRAEEDVPF